MSDVTGQVSANLTSVVKTAVDYLDDFQPRTKSVRYNYRESTSEMTFLIEVPDNRRRKFGKLKIPISEGFRFKEMFSLPDYNPVNAVKTITDGCLTFDPSELPSHDEYIITINGDVPPETLDEIVHRKVPEDPKKEGDVDTYWMHSAIKRPGVMKEIYDDMQVDNVDLGIRVGVQRCFSNAIPEEVLDVFDRTNELIRASNEDDRNEVHVASRRRFKAREQLATTQGEASEIIRSLASADNIRDYITVDEPYRRRNINSTPSNKKIFPEEIAVDVTTDLNLDRKAADGELLFNKSEYQEHIRDKMDSKVL